MTLETERLILYPLDASQLALWTEDLPSLERELGCVYKAEPLEGFFLDILKGQLVKAQADPENFIWLTFWLIVRKSDRVVVGSADFKAPPDENGAVELGYGLGEGFTGNGYMTETVGEMCAWALAQPMVSAVIAETELGNLASQHILERNGFAVYQEGETLWWRKDA